MADVTGAEMIVGVVVTGATAAGGAVVAWFAKQVVGVRDDVRTIKTKLYGDENEEQRQGLVTEVHTIHGVVDDIDKRVVGVEGRVSHIEKICAVQHGEIIFRDAPEGA